jgi:hypothetical protein
MIYTFTCGKDGRTATFVLENVQADAAGFLSFLYIFCSIHRSLIWAPGLVGLGEMVLRFGGATSHQPHLLYQPHFSTWSHAWHIKLPPLFLSPPRPVLHMSRSPYCLLRLLRTPTIHHRLTRQIAPGPRHFTVSAVHAQTETMAPPKDKKGKIELKTPKGTKDWEGKDMVIRDKIFNTITTVFKRHGGVTIDTPYGSVRPVGMVAQAELTRTPQTASLSFVKS